jgi:hypothetical protein
MIPLLFGDYRSKERVYPIGIGPDWTVCRVMAAKLKPMPEDRRQSPR